jgi:hypothetical protein
VLPFACSRRRQCKLPHEREKRFQRPTRTLRVRNRSVELRSVYELNFPVLAYAEAILRTFQPSATDALPCRHALGHQLGFSTMSQAAKLRSHRAVFAFSCKLFMVMPFCA